MPPVEADAVDLLRKRTVVSAAGLQIDLAVLQIQRGDAGEVAGAVDHRTGGVFCRDPVQPQPIRGRWYVRSGPV